MKRRTIDKLKEHLAALEPIVEFINDLSSGADSEWETQDKAYKKSHEGISAREPFALLHDASEELSWAKKLLEKTIERAEMEG